MLIVITDGKGNVSIDSEKKPMQELLEIGEKVSKISQIETMVIDIERGGLMQFGIAKKLADAMGGKYCKLDQIKSRAIVDIVKKERRQ
jgi:magnesium chelatase subunit D